MIQKISELKGVTSVKRNNGGVSIFYDGEPRTSHDLLKTLISSGYQIYSFKPSDRGLEEYYLSIMSDEKGVS
jgi:hypothetical protein